MVFINKMLNINKRQLTQISNPTHRSSAKQSRAISENKLSKFSSHETSRKSTINGNNPNPVQYKCWSFLEARKQSQLNSLFNVRKNKLNQITKANLQIHEKINTQNSHYSLQKYQNKANEGVDRSRGNFRTVDQLKQEERVRSILGPIGNFQPLTAPQSFQSNVELIEIIAKRTKLPLFSTKNRRKGKQLQENKGLPSIFTFY